MLAGERPAITVPLVVSRLHIQFSITFSFFVVIAYFYVLTFIVNVLIIFFNHVMVGNCDLGNMSFELRW